MESDELVTGSSRGSDAFVKGVQIGLIAYGATHLVIAAAALPLAWGERTEARADQQGALAQMAEQPLGDVVLWVIVLGMLCLVLWQVGEAILGHREDDGTKRLLKRAASAGRAVIYAALGWSAAGTAMGTGTSGGSGGSSSPDGITARLMSAPGGALLVGAMGLAIVAVGIFLGYRGWAEKFTRHLQAAATQGASRTPTVWLGKVGYIAKGAALGAVGALFLAAAVQHQPKESGGLDVALNEMLQQPFGPVLLALVAGGLGCFGVYCFFWARYLRR